MLPFSARFLWNFLPSLQLTAEGYTGLPRKLLHLWATALDADFKSWIEEMGPKFRICSVLSKSHVKVILKVSPCYSSMGDTCLAAWQLYNVNIVLVTLITIMNRKENKITVEKIYIIYPSTTVILKIVYQLYMYSLPFSIFKLTGKTGKENTYRWVKKIFISYVPILHKEHVKL